MTHTPDTPIVVNLCACGCGAEARKTFIRGHSNGTTPKTLPVNTNGGLCHCGCGELAPLISTKTLAGRRVAGQRRPYFGHHYKRKGTMTEGTCTMCGETKPRSEFYRVANWFASYCKPCERSRDLVTQSNRKQALKRYGLTIESYNERLAAQDGACAICGKTSNGAKPFFVDHDHDTDQTRDLLCTNCNSLIGSSMENIKILEASIHYLIKWGKG